MRRLEAARTSAASLSALSSLFPCSLEREIPSLSSLLQVSPALRASLFLFIMSEVSLCVCLSCNISCVFPLLLIPLRQLDDAGTRLLRVFALFPFVFLLLLLMMMMMLLLLMGMVVN